MGAHPSTLSQLPSPAHLCHPSALAGKSSATFACRSQGCGFGTAPPASWPSHGSRLAPTLEVSGHLRVGAPVLALVVRSLVNARAPERDGGKPFLLSSSCRHMAGRSRCFSSLPHASSCVSPAQGHGPDLQAAITAISSGRDMGYCLERENFHSSSQGSRKVSPSLYPPGLVDDGGTEPQGSKGQVRPCAGADQPPPWVNEGWLESGRQHEQSLTRSWKET